MTFLSVAQGVAARVGLSRPASIVTSDGQTERRLAATIQDAAESLARRHEWSALVRFHDFTPVAEAAPLPDDYDRMAYGETLWRSNGVGFGPVNGPVSPSTWAADTAMSWTQYNGDWRIFGGAIQFSYGFPSADLSFEYITKNIIRGDGDEPDKPEFTLDGDVSYLDERLLRQTAIWMWKQSNGLPYAEDMSTAERMLETMSANDVGMKRISFGRRREFMPDGTWGGVIGGDLANADYLEPE